MKEIFQAIATSLGWNFDYGRKDFHNWREVVPGDMENYLFVDPIIRKPVYGQGGGLTSRTYSGHFMILRNSDLDEEYDDTAGADGKYQLYIEPLIQEVETGVFWFEINCTYDLLIEWEITEIINVFSENYDGILVKYKFTDYQLNRIL